MTGEPRFVEVAFPLPVEGTFEYALPAELPLADSVAPGTRVYVPWGKRNSSAYVLAVRDARLPGPRLEPREVLRVIDAEPVIPPSMVDVILDAAADTLTPPGIALAAASPPGTVPREGLRVELLEPGRKALGRGETPGTLGRVLWALAKRPLPESTLRARFPAAVPALDRLERIGWIRRERTTERPRVRTKTERVYRRAAGLDLAHWRSELARAPRRLELLEQIPEEPIPLPSSDPLRALLALGLVVREEREVTREPRRAELQESDEIPEPTPHQREAISSIGEAIEERRDQSFLLYGITGSGKTEVYLRASALALARERSVIVLVPEISLTHQIVARFQARFGDRVAVLHSGLSAGERFDQWRRIREGAYPIAIGARSAVFAPFEDPGLIVIDEEHDGAYKSEERFRYHARDVARLRARSARCPLVLGSATPDLETAYSARIGDVQTLRLPERVARRPLPEVQMIDMGEERRRAGRFRLLSGALRKALAETITARQQAILFLNRRGFATFAYCFACGHAIRCKHCDISLVYHSSEGPPRPDSLEQGLLRCHYCGYQETPRVECAACGSPEGALLGFGTEQLEEEVNALFPHARVLRLDRDTSARKGAQRSILERFHRHEADVLVGTQMVAKGHDVPRVTLVGVVAADLGLHFPDYRAGERTFQLLAQVAGRAGRGEDPGRVLIQTFLPRHYAIALAERHDYPSFFTEELRRREPHGYPPYRALWQVALSGKDAEQVEQAARRIATLVESLPAAGSVELLGPAPAPIAKLRDHFRWQLLLLGERGMLRRTARDLASQTQRRFPGVDVRLVPSPVQML